VRALSRNIQLHKPLSLTLSPSDGAREKIAALRLHSPNGESITVRKKYSLAPSDGERVRERGRFDCILTAKCLFILQTNMAIGLRSKGKCATAISKKFPRVGRGSCEPERGCPHPRVSDLFHQKVSG
jgi:hypothetical protein